MGPFIDRVAIDHRIFEDEFCPGDQVGTSSQSKLQSLNGSIKSSIRPACCPVVGLVVIARLFGTPVDKLRAVIELANGVDRHLAAGDGADSGDTGAA